ncbi:MAG: c-type cytochrome [Chitinophagaceae bacterium]|nr:c-type cytochrome [Chitinophagaceae bacterium]
MKSYKKLVALAALFAFVFIGIAAVEEPAGEFKNLQVLPKNITPDSLDKIMDGFNQGLGVNCAFCHTENKQLQQLEAEKDTKPEKEITRNMMRMTMDINKNYFQFNEEAVAQKVQAVTCYTCHKGIPIPEKEKKKPAAKDPFNFKSN